MGLDVYVGPFSRYYAGAWETIVQQYGRESGLSVEIIRPQQPKAGLFSRILGLLTGRERRADPAAAVSSWMAGLSRYSPAGKSFQWSDRPDGEYFTDKPAWDCYGALVLWAAYDEAQTSTYPVTSQHWDQDPIFTAAVANPSGRYRHLVGNTEIWLPGEFDPPFSGPTPSGETAVFGSNRRLLRELEELNQRTWQASASDLESWRKGGAEHDGPFETSAKFGFAVFHDLTAKSVGKRLPMKLDY
jgi:hypothetical protein